MKKVQRNFLLVVVLLLFVSVKSELDENLSTAKEKGIIKGNSDNSELSGKVQSTKSDDSECPCVNSEDNNENSKLEKHEQVPSSSDSKTSNSEDTNNSQQSSDSKEANENANECNQQPGSQSAKSEELKEEDSEDSAVALDNSKQQKSKKDDKSEKTNLNDVNALVKDSDHVKSKKRETYGDSPSYAMGLPRDASYFFDDLEPFINNNSDAGRIGRAVPSRDKNQKSKLKGKGKEIMEDDLEDDDEEEKNEEDEKQDEDDYDDDEDVDSDCKPTTGCPTTPKCTTTCPTTRCPTTRCPTTTTTCPTTTTKCTTKHRCPTTCKTTTQCTTPQCPRVCGNGADNLEKDMDKESDTSWDSNKKKHRHGKRRFHNKENLIEG